MQKKKEIQIALYCMYISSRSLEFRLNTVLMTSTFSPESLPIDLKRQEVTPSAAEDADSDLEILEEDDENAVVVVAESAETTTKKTEEGEEEEEFWESLPVIDSRPLKKRKKKARPAQ